MVEYRIEHSPAYSLLKVWLKPGESITVEPGSYMLHKGEVEVKTSSGGILRGLSRMLMGGESFFMNTVTARSDVELWIAPGLAGDIAAVELNGGSLVIQDGSYLAHIGDIEVSTAWRGLKGLLAEGELVWTRASGTGIVFINSYGAMEQINLGPGEKATIDNAHFVALDDTVSWNVRKWGGWKTLFFGGEGIVLDVVGPGRVWVQTRNLPLFARIIRRFLPSS
ncbi:MAG: TIGR00266 family protein [Desulfurococcales archaeon]|nr:TIGR00266 family protein [Desulfurococcales archaeon]